MTDIKSGSLEIERLKDFGFAPEAIIALSDDNTVVFVQFLSLSNIEDIWDCVEVKGIGLVPARRTDGTTGPTAGFQSRFRDLDLPVGRFRRRFRDRDLPVGRWRGRFRDRDLPVGTAAQGQAYEAEPIEPSEIPGLGNVRGARNGIMPPVEISTAEDAPGPIALAFADVLLADDGLTGTVGVTLRVLSESGFRVVDEIECQIMIDQPFMTPDPSAELGAIHSVADFRSAIDAVPGLSMEAREVLVEQAIVLIRDVYVHLPLKRAMHSIDPVQRLRLLQQRLYEMPDLDFHAELLDIFKELRDLHTNLTLPFPFGSQIAFLGVLVERFFVDDLPRYVVSKVASGLSVDDRLVAGVEVTHWNGMPIEAAVARNADKEAGSNIPSRMARGLENLTLRSLRTSLMPDEDWVDLTYVRDGIVCETRLHWLVYESFDDVEETLGQAIGSAGSAHQQVTYNLAIDERQMLFGRAKQQLFSKPIAAASEKGVAPAAEASGTRHVRTVPERPEISAEVITDENGTEFGYIRLWSFFMRDRDINGFITAFVRLLEDEMPESGLIIDVRGNGGGFIIAAEFLLQLLTWRRITPQPAQFIASSAALDLARKVPGMQPWVPSLEEAVQTGALFSKALPISSPSTVNAVGQIYFGPIVLITDAFCYSACDMFAAGFQDHNIGTILGVDERTGAGGANVVTQNSLLGDWHGSPLEVLPNGAGMRVSLRRTMRVGNRSGDPVEDLGVTPDFIHPTTMNDLLNGNEDLRARALAILRQGQPRRFEIAFVEVGTKLVLRLELAGIESVDLYLDGRPVESREAVDGQINFEMDLPEGDRVIELFGFGGNGEMTARRRISFEQVTN